MSANPEEIEPRFIPAGAGNTLSAWPQLRSLAVYPRWRREHFTINARFEINFGLSPLAQGTR
ncbi:TPA: hypothetical protein IG014_002283 [Escherichia coli]|nr:hypothetical protein [Escherichia coli]HAO0416702.1 hypothetical protein [Escherichia coli]HAO0437857.1 hypothetical protein [Escherichia coli]HAO0442607.1 hypothetical protein [Escherichia coli]